jgi:hypothetical protein
MRLIHSLATALLLLPAACAPADGTRSDSGFVADDDEPTCPDPEMESEPGTDICE